MPPIGGANLLDINGQEVTVPRLIGVIQFTCANPPVVTFAEGFASTAPTRAGAGDYSLAPPPPASYGTGQLAVIVQGIGAGFASFKAVPNGPPITSLQILNFDAAGAGQDVGSVQVFAFAI